MVPHYRYTAFSEEPKLGGPISLEIQLPHSSLVRTVSLGGKSKFVLDETYLSAPENLRIGIMIYAMLDQGNN